MKRSRIGLMIIAAVSLLVGCVEKEETQSQIEMKDPEITVPYIEGYVVDEREGALLVVANEEVSLPNTKEKYRNAVWFSPIPENIEVGASVRVWTTSPIAESYPAQGTADRWEVSDEVTPQGAALSETDAIRIALKEKANPETLLVVESVTYNADHNEWEVDLRYSHNGEVHTAVVKDE